MSIQLDLIRDMETKIIKAARREGVAPDAYVTNILSRHPARQEKNVSESEASLLEQINLGLTENDWQRYHELRLKLADRTLSSNEQRELIYLISLSDRLEEANVRRLTALIKLAELRDTSLDSLMTQLDLRPPLYV
jgi:hypothetical protein